MSNEENGEIFYSRVSSCFLINDLYLLLNDADKVLLKDIYIRLCKDELPIVRRAASQQLLTFSEVICTNQNAGILGGGLASTVIPPPKSTTSSANILQPNYNSLSLTSFSNVNFLTSPEVIQLISQDFLTLLLSLLTDDDQTTQVTAFESLSRFTLLLKKLNCVTQISNDILPAVKNFSEDPSWKIRLALVKYFKLFAYSFTPAEISTHLFSCLVSLALDNETDVRSNAMSQFLPFYSLVDNKTYITEIMNILEQLIEDPMSQVRKLAIDLCIDIIALNGNEFALLLSDLFIKFINDVDHLVRLRIIKKLDLIAEICPPLCVKLTDNLKESFISTNWRVRKAIVSVIPSLILHMGNEYFMTNLLQPCLLLLKDGVQEVRTETSKVLSKILLSSNQNIDWCYTNIFSSLMNYQQEDFLTRLSMVTILEGFFLLLLENSSASSHQNHKIQGEILHFLTLASKDKVPNIRMRVSQVVYRLMNHPSIASVTANSALGSSTGGTSLESTLRNDLQLIYNELSNDKDKDVRFFLTNPIYLNESELNSTQGNEVAVNE